MKKIYKKIPAVLFFAAAYLPALRVNAQTEHYGPEQKISVVQNFPAAVRPGSDFMMEIKINKGNVTGLAKFQQYIPSGMTATAIDNSGADFSFDAQNVKFIWTSVPSSESLTLRYKVSVSASLLGKKYLSGTFSYVENDRTKKNSLVPKEIDITPTAPATEVAASAAKPAEEEVERQKAEGASASSAIPRDEPEPEETKTGLAAGSASAAQTTPEVSGTKKTEPAPGETTEPLAQPEPAPPAPAPTATASKKESAVPDHVDAPSAAGVTFRVQIAAMNEKHFRRKNYFQEKFGLQMEVKAEEHEGLKKYTVGNFNSYTQAAKLRDEIRSSAQGSFVVAYKDGVRIPVSEAIEQQRKK